MTKREAVLSASKALLDGIEGVFAYRMPTFDLRQFPAVVQIDGPESRDDAGSGVVQVTMQITVAIIVSAEDDSELGPLLTDIQGKVREAYAADYTLGGTVGSIFYTELGAPVQASEVTLPTIRQDLVFEAERFEDALNPFVEG